MAIRFETGAQVLTCSYCGKNWGVSTKTMGRPDAFSELIIAMEKRHEACEAKPRRIQTPAFTKTLKERALERLEKEMRSAGLSEQEQKFFAPMERAMAEHMRKALT